MASSQPANTEIQVYRRVRAQAANERHDSVKQMGRLRDKYVVIPAEEIRVLHTSDDSLITDAWRYGHPVVRYSAPATSVQTVYNNVDNLAMPVRLTVDRREFQIEKTEDAIADDLFQDVSNA